MNTSTHPSASRCPIDHRAQATLPGPNGCPVSSNAAAFNPFEPAYMEAPAEYLRWSREQEPVFWSPQLGYWVVTRYEDVKAVFRDNILFSPANALEKITPATPEVTQVLQRYGYAMNRTMVNEDEPDHMERRRLLTDAFLPERLVAYEPMVRALARQYMDRFIDKGRAELVSEMFYEIPLNIALKFLGVPDDGAEQLRQFAVAHTLNTWGRPTPQEQLQIAENVGRFWQTAQSILDDMRKRPDGEGWMYETIRQHLRHPDIVPESYLRSMMMAILAAAHETTSNATANAFLTLLRQREAWDAICENPALIPNAVEECLRVSGSIIAWRRVATADAVVGGVPIPKGGKLLLVQVSANFDSRHFENPEEVDLYRENAVEHMTFGYGAHQCMGKNIGRMQMRVFLEEFTRRLPHIGLVENQTIRYLPNTSFRGPDKLWVEWDPARNPERTGAAAPADAGAFYIGPPSKDGLARTVRLQEKHIEGDGLFRFVLADPRGRALPAWTAGAHIDLIAGGFRRKYSLCGRADDRHTLQVVVQREADGRGGSRHFCDLIAAGSTLQLAGPKNLFRLDESGRRFVLIAGGIGITPMLAMADRLKHLGKPYEIHYAGRSRRQMALLARLEQDHAARLNLYVKAEGRRMDLRALLADVDGGTRVYACGPDRLIDELETMSEQWPENVLHFEHFSAESSALDPDKEHGFVAELKDSNVSVTVAPDQTLLQALQAAGFDVPCDCGEGLCGTCEVNVVEGDVDHRDKVLTKAERAANQRLMACCSRAAGTKIVLAL
ncbi:cytochrome P450/oxidoreductase [Parapusillimonas granuli]|uniref:Cytochrome P450 n=1 Tax=Parapusillimonas granuli TaxID=380911 RepID=A0A853FQI9_9BURK|nr:cytochrome P450/oxidoreductase [Parapusillimonas granuli]MBB5216631.1 cytochrome P450/ferredoxin-NADP reductase [Parapusillimonas granuli]NYT48064.1 cytochrome P450 [Parapusillimonas granuli]